MQPSGVWNDGIAVIAGLLACGLDLKWRKIPNWLTISMLLIGLVGHAFSGWWGVLNALGGCFTGLVLLVIPFLAGGIGGGDVKLLMALGALLGVGRIFWVFLYAGIAGGVFSLLYLIYKMGIKGAALRLRLLLTTIAGCQKRETLTRVATGQQLKIPYGVAIFCGLGWEIILKLDAIHALWG